MARPADGTAADLRAWVVRALARLAPGFPGEPEDETPLAEGGLCLDSLALMDLLAEVETRLGVTVSETEVSAEHFGSVGRLIRFLARRRAGAAEDAHPAEA